MAQTAVYLPHQYLANHIFHPVTSNKESIRSLRKGTNSAQWTKSLANEIGRLAQGVGKHRNAADQIKGTDTIFFIPHSAVPTSSKVTYANFICDYKPLKKEKFRVRCTVGGNKLEYEDDPSSPAAGLLDIKIHLNSTISDASKGARYATADIENMYLNNPMKTYRYMRIPIVDIPNEILQKYNIKHLIHNGHIYVEIRKGMYGLKEAGIIAY